MSTSKIIRDNPETGVRLTRVSVTGGFPYWVVHRRDGQGSQTVWRQDFCSTEEQEAFKRYESVILHRVAENALA